MPVYPCLLPHPSEPRVLLLPEEEGFGLPAVEDDAGWFAHVACSVARKLSAKLGIQATALRHIRHAGTDFCELENHSPGWTPSEGGRWVGARELADLLLTSAEQREVLESWLQDALQGEVPALRAPWERRGWFADAVTWTSAQLDLLGYSASGPIEQYKTAWGSSSILRVLTTGGHLYFKADFAKPPSEPALVLALAERWPDNVPAIVAADLDRRWMLMREFDGRNVDERSLTECQESVRLFAELQIGCAPDLARWFGLGCQDVRLERLPGYLAQMLADPAATQPGTPQGLSEEEIERLSRCLGHVEAMCAGLAEHGLPPSLVQQDFRGGNVWKGERTYLCFDWSDTVIAHPFFSPVRFNEYIRIRAGEDPQGEASQRLTQERRLAIRDAYLDPWTRYQPMDRLQTAFEQAWDLNPIYQAIRWYFDTQYLERTAPWGSDIASGLPWHLRRVLEATGT
jgi:hypothetical protein